MRSVKLAGMTGLALLLAACGGASEEPVPEAESPAPAVEETAVSDGAAEEAETTAAAPPAEVAAASTAAAPAPAPASAPAATAAPAMFAICKACHSVAPGENGIGPTLAGVFNAKAGHIGDFDYSEAMLASGLKWDDATLNAYLENPKTVVPGTNMSFAGLKNAAKRQEVVDYLKTL